VPGLLVPSDEPTRAFDVLDEAERPCTHDVPLVPTDIALEDVRLVNPVPRRRQRVNERRRWPLELEGDDIRFRRLDGLDLEILALARGRDSGRGVDDLLVS